MPCLPSSFSCDFVCVSWRQSKYTVYKQGLHRIVVFRVVLPCRELFKVITAYDSFKILPLQEKHAFLTTPHDSYF